MGDVRACLKSKLATSPICSWQRSWSHWTTSSVALPASCRTLATLIAGLVQPAPVEVEVVQENSAPLFTAAYSYRTQEYARRRTAGSVSSGQVGSMPQ